MKRERLRDWFGGEDGPDGEVPVVTARVVVVGSGAAGLSAADRLAQRGIRDTIVVTERADWGASRNAGSDKQTYYRLTLAGDEADSVLSLARTFFGGGCMHGDLALAEAALSVRGFYRLVELGVPFPDDPSGGYPGYRTDHDPRQRGTSCGPLTSRIMAECLERSARSRGVRILEGHRVLSILSLPGSRHARPGQAAAPPPVTGLLTLTPEGPCLFRCAAVVWAGGGPGALYADSAYPESQSGGLGPLLEAGVPLVNLTEWQYGMAALHPRWNLSGSYQQVVPEYMALAEDGTSMRLCDVAGLQPDEWRAMTFLKGYQWPFQAERALDGSSRIDLAVLAAMSESPRRRVVLDYRTDPPDFDLGRLSGDARAYLAAAGALVPGPAARLRILNEPAYRFFLERGTDLARDPLDTAVCAQHCNGGAEVDDHWRTRVPGLFVCGEAAGTFGVRRPGGAALASTQAGSLRAAECLALQPPRLPDPAGFLAAATEALALFRARVGDLVRNGRPAPGHGTGREPGARRDAHARAMSRWAGILRQPTAMASLLEETVRDLALPGWGVGIREGDSPAEAFLHRDLLLTQAAVLAAMGRLAESGCGSRGGALTLGPDGVPLPTGRCLEDRIGRVRLVGSRLETDFVPVRPIPVHEAAFEALWRDRAANAAKGKEKGHGDW